MHFKLHYFQFMTTISASFAETGVCTTAVSPSRFQVLRPSFARRLQGTTPLVRRTARLPQPVFNKLKASVAHPVDIPLCQFCMWR